MNRNTIILSGGWGYGNLGDDALLEASVNMIRKRFPNNPIVVLSYDIISSKGVIPENEDLKYSLSLHNVLFADEIDNKVTVAYSFIGRLRLLINETMKRHRVQNRDRKLAKEVLHSPQCFIEELSSKVNPFTDLCKNAFLYIMSGGGYLNSWGEMLVSKYVEMSIAKQCGLKCLMVGQTIGPWRSKESDLLGKLIYSMADGAFFRDINSISDIHRWGFQCINKVIPDLALLNKITPPCGKLKRITFIPFGLHTTHVMDNIVANLVKISQANGYDIVITASQLWKGSIQMCADYFIELKMRHANVQFIIPRDVNELQRTIAESALCISGNLHGLILAYRASTPIISINDGRKFKSFMKLIGQEQALIPSREVNKDNIFHATQSVTKINFIHFKDEINNAFNELTKSL